MDEAGWFADLRVQLLEGQVVVTPMGPRHCAGISLACEAMERIFERGRFYVRCQLSLPVDRFSEPFPDVAVVPGGPRDYIDRHPTTALLVVEVSDSTLGEDREKARLYAKAGVPEYWIVNLNDRTLEVRRKPVKGRRRKGAAPFAELAVLTAADTVRPVSSPRGSPALAVADLLP
jgi:Uma2 family endonuclease